MTIAVDRDLNFATSNVVIHHSTFFDGKTPVTCGRTEVPKPASTNWRHIDCPECAALRPERLRVLAEADACRTCRAIHGWTIRGAASSPLPVPVAGCTNRGGWCRCSVVNA